MYVSLIMIKCKGLQLQYSRGEFLTLPKFYSNKHNFYDRDRANVHILYRFLKQNTITLKE